MDGNPASFPTQPTRSLLAYLVNQGHRRQPRLYVAEAVWPEVEEERALNRLRTALVAVRSAGEPYDLVDGDRYEIGLHSELFHSDLSLAQRLYQQARVTQEPTVELRLLTELNTLIEPGFLPGWRDPWTDGIRLHWASREKEVKLRIAQLALSLQDHAVALSMVDHLLTLEPADEEGWTLYFRLMVAEGRDAEALDRFRVVRKAWLEQSHLDFSAELMSLAKRIRDKQIVPENALPAKISQAERDLVIDVFEKQLDSDPRVVLELCTSQAFRFEAMHSPNDALGLLRRVIERTAPGDSLRIEAQSLAAKLATMVCDYATTFDYCEDIMEHSSIESSPYRQALNQLGFGNFELRNWELADKYLRQHYEANLAYGSKSEQAISHLQLGSIAWHQLRMDECDYHYAEGERLLNESGTETDQRSLTVFYGNTMYVATIRGDWKRAKEYADLSLRRAQIERAIMVVNSVKAVRAMLYAMDGERAKARQMASEGFAGTFRNRIFRMHQVSADYMGATLGLLDMHAEGNAVLDAYTRFREHDQHEHSPAEKVFLEVARGACGNTDRFAEWADEARPSRLVSNVCHHLDTA
ncbi:MAG: hypothetical protein JNJ45_03990 [Chthonomonas sp.]|nr:hypothetical protein [Chthonomonas sp.]